MAQQKLFLESTPTHGIKMLYYTNPTQVLGQVHVPSWALALSLLCVPHLAYSARVACEVCNCL